MAWNIVRYRDLTTPPLINTYAQCSIFRPVDVFASMFLFLFLVCVCVQIITLNCSYRASACLDAYRARYCLLWQIHPSVCHTLQGVVYSNECTHSQTFHQSLIIINNWLIITIQLKEKYCIMPHYFLWCSNMHIFNAKFLKWHQDATTASIWHGSSTRRAPA